jgi:hypothetical protein
VKHRTQTEFLNVDFDISPAGSGLALVRALGATVIVLHKRKRFICLELARQPKSVDDAIQEFARLIEQLAAKARHVWDGCQSRTMNVGIRAGKRPHSAEFKLSQATIDALARIRADVVFTIYAFAGRRPVGLIRSGGQVS